MNNNTFLLVLKGAPLSVLMALWMHGPLDRQQMITTTGWKHGAVDNALRLLEKLELIDRPHYRKWAVSNSFHQLPFPKLLMASEEHNDLNNNADVADCDVSENPENGFSAYGNSDFVGSESPKNVVSEPPNQPPKSHKTDFQEQDHIDHIDQILLDDDDDDDENRYDVNNFREPHSPFSRTLLESIGISGAYLDQMAQMQPFEILGSWWYLQCEPWPRNPKAVLCTHLLNRHETPPPFLELSRWWLDASVWEHKALIDAIQITIPAPDNLARRAFDAACKVWDTVGSFDLSVQATSKRTFQYTQKAPI